MASSRFRSSSTVNDDGQQKGQETSRNGNGDGFDRQAPANPAATSTMNVRKPGLFHRLKSEASILSLAVSESSIYAGTQDGLLLGWTLRAYEQLEPVQAHRNSLLSLSLSKDGKMLFSSGGDAIVNVWDTGTEPLHRLYSIYSTYDVGDIFCVVYSSKEQRVYLGAQNTSIQWCDLSKRSPRLEPDPSSHPFHRSHKFFDSKGPGGKSTPRSRSPEAYRSLGGQDLEIDENDMIQYAHYGYVHCMLIAQNLNTKRHNGETLISGGGDGSIKLWPMSPSQEASTALQNGDASVLSLTLDDTLLYSGKLEGDVDVWDLETYQQVRRIKASVADILTISVGHDLIFAGTSESTAKILNRHHTTVCEWCAHDRLILASAATVHNKKDLYITGGNDGCVSVWDVSDFCDRPAKTSITSDEELVNTLSKFISYQTLSSKEQYATDCRRGASFLRNTFKRFGAETELLNTNDQRNPVVFARFRGKRTKAAKHMNIMFYGHYDVVSADNENRIWRSDPFALQATNGFLYGRGVSDNKGPLLAALYAVADIKEKLVGSDIVFLVEGEEESGSRGFANAVRKAKGLIGEVNWILLANSYWLTDDIPCLTYGLRGVIRATIELRSRNPDLHSGMDGSRLLKEPMHDLVAILASLTKEDGSVSISGFYDRIPPISRDENERYELLTRSLLEQNPHLGTFQDVKASFQAKWREPSLTIHRINHSGSAGSSIIPRTAKADISIRLVPNQTTQQVFSQLEKHVTNFYESLRSSNEMIFKLEHQAEPWLGDPNNQLFKVLEAAVSDAWAGVPSQLTAPASPETGIADPKLPGRVSKSTTGTKTKSRTLTTSLLSTVSPPTLPIGKENAGWRTGRSITTLAQQKPLYIREGGSIPAVRFLEQEFDAPAAHLPCGQASDNAHLDNERFRLLNLYKSREIFRRVFLELSRS